MGLRGFILAIRVYTLLGICLASRAFAAEPLPGAPGWKVEISTATSGASLDAEKETEWFELIPPTGDPVTIGGSYLDMISAGEIKAQEVYDAARLPVGKKTYFERIKHDYGAAKKSAHEDQPVAGARGPDTLPSAAPEKEEFLWDLARRKPVATPLNGKNPPPPEGELKLVGTSTLWSYKPNVLPPWTCKRLKPGEHTVVAFDRAEMSPTDVEGLYRLRRESKQHFVAELNLSYYPDFDFDLPMKPEEVDPHFRKKAQACLETFNPAFRNAATGQTLELRLTQDQEVPKVHIAIGPASARSNSHKYESDADCSVFVHEMFHLLGLPDEYDEPGEVKQAEIETIYQNTATGEIVKKLITFKAELDCRSISDDRSIMKSTFIQEIRVHGAKGQQGQASSVLFPAHFRAITEPGCDDVNRLYYRCASNAYRFSKPFPKEWLDYGVKELDYQGCLNVPPECGQNSEAWLK